MALSVKLNRHSGKYSVSREVGIGLDSHYIYCYRARYLLRGTKRNNDIRTNQQGGSIDLGRPQGYQIFFCGIKSSGGSHNRNKSICLLTTIVYSSFRLHPLRLTSSAGHLTLIRFIVGLSADLKKSSNLNLQPA